MKKLLWLFLLLALVPSLHAQTQAAIQREYSATAATAFPGVRISGQGLQYHQIVWALEGTISTCVVQVDQSTDGVTWSTQIISGQTCTSAGSSALTAGVTTWVRVNISTLTGGGTLTVVYQAFIRSPNMLVGIGNPTDQTSIGLSDEFIGGTLVSTTIGGLGWTMSGTAACGTAVATAGAIPNVGLFTATTGAVSGDTCGITGAGASALGALGNFAPWEMVWVFKVPSNATAGAYLGFSDSLTAVPSAWAGFKYDTSVDATFHLCVNATCDATSPAANTNFHRLRIWSSVAAKLWMQLDTAAAVSFCASGCTNTVTPTTNVVTPIAQAVTRTTAAKTLTVDYFGFRAGGLSR